MKKLVMTKSNRSNKPQVSRPLVDLWEDTPISFPFNAIYRHARMIKPLCSSLVVLSICLMFPMSLILIWLLELCFPSQLPRLFSTVVLLFGMFSPFIFTITLLSHQRKISLTNDRRLQCFINRNGTTSIPAIIQLLLLTLYENGHNRLESRLITNLHTLLTQMDHESGASLNLEERSFLCGLVDPHGYSNKTLKPNQLQKLMEFGSMLSSPAVHALGVLGGDDSILALRNRLARTESPRMIELINKALHMSSSRSGGFDSTSDRLPDRSHNSNSQIGEIGLLPGDNMSNPVKSRVALYGGVVVYFVTIFTMLHFGNYQLPAYMLMSLYLISQVLIVIYAIHKFRFLKRMHRVGLVLSQLDDPTYLRIVTSNLETRYGPDPTRLLPSLLAGEVVQNITSQSIPVLNSVQLNALHKMIMPRAITEPQRYDLDNPLPDIRPTSTLLKSLALLGDASSVRFLERFIQQTSDQKLNEIANETLIQLKERLAVTPHQLLRASERTDNGLLQPAGNESSSDLLHTTVMISNIYSYWCTI